MNFLFFFVHPSKFHVFKHTINALLSENHNVDILITSKDVLEELVKSQGWKYTNIFPEGRKIHGLHPYLSSAINLIRTLYRLYSYSGNKHFDLFITDDLLVYIGKLKKIPTIVFCDDDISIVKQFGLILKKADYILAPDITDLGQYNHQKISFPGYKELAYLHPNLFTPNVEIVKKFNPDLEPFFILRLVSLSAYHDIGKKGLSNQKVKQIISLLEKKGRVYISSERPLPESFEQYRLSINPEDMPQVLYYADLFIGDSQTMTSEAAVLGTPAFRCNDFAGKISVMEEKERKYRLSFNYSSEQFDMMYHTISEILEEKNLNKIFQERRLRMLQDKIDLSAFMIWLFSEFPRSIDIYKSQPDIFRKFGMKTPCAEYLE